MFFPSYAKLSSIVTFSRTPPRQHSTHHLKNPIHPSTPLPSSWPHFHRLSRISPLHPHYHNEQAISSIHLGRRIALDRLRYRRGICMLVRRESRTYIRERDLVCSYFGVCWIVGCGFLTRLFSFGRERWLRRG